MKKIVYALLGVITALTIHSHAHSRGVYFRMVINFVPSPGACQSFINSGALYMKVDPGIPESMTGGERAEALVNSNSTVAFINAHPGYTVVVPALNEHIFCSAQCALTQANCLRQCRFAVRNFYSVQMPTYAVPNGTIYIRCPTLTMSKYPEFPSDPYTLFPYSR